MINQIYKREARIGANIYPPAKVDEKKFREGYDRIFGKKSKWNKGLKSKPETFRKIEARIKHCNENLGMEIETVRGQFEDDGFYLHDGGELSWNWDIVAWRYL